jgi:hypothetical protein
VARREEQASTRNIFLGDMMDYGFADMHIIKCVYLPRSPLSFSSLKFFFFPHPPARVDIRNVSGVSTRHNIKKQMRTFCPSNQSSSST